MVYGINMIWFSQEVVRLLGDYNATKRIAVEAVNAYAKQFTEEHDPSVPDAKKPDGVKFDRTICNVIKCVVMKDNPHLSGQVEVNIIRRTRSDPGEAQIKLTRLQSHLRLVTPGCNLLH